MGIWYKYRVDFYFYVLSVKVGMVWNYERKMMCFYFKPSVWNWCLFLCIKIDRCFTCHCLCGKVPTLLCKVTTYLVSSFQAKIITLFTTQTSCVVQYVYFLIISILIWPYIFKLAIWWLIYEQNELESILIPHIVNRSFLTLKRNLVWFYLNKYSNWMKCVFF